MSGDSLVDRDGRSLWHPYTQHALEPEPLPVASARGSRLRLEDGREIIDAISSWWTCLHGHGREELVEAMAKQARQLDHVLFAGATHEPAVALAEELLAAYSRPAASHRPEASQPDDRETPALERVFYSDDGSTAVEVALKICWQSWRLRGEMQKTLFVALEGGYHGDTIGAMSVGDPDPFFLPFAPLLFEVRRVAPEGDALAALLEQVGDRVCAVIVEPLVQGAGGMRMHDAEFLRHARRATAERGIPLVFDEVMTGFGRTGALFAAHRAGVMPDIACLAKGLTGGILPLAATLVSRRLYESFLSPDRARAFFHGHSMTANPIACAVARVSLELCRRDAVPKRLAAIGAALHEALQELPGEGLARNLRMIGGIVAFDLPASAAGVSAAGASAVETQGGYLDDRSLRLRRVALDHGVLLRPLGDVVYAMPPACTTEAEIGRIAGAMREVTRAGRRP